MLREILELDRPFALIFDTGVNFTSKLDPAGLLAWVVPDVLIATLHRDIENARDDRMALSAKDKALCG